MPTGQAVRSSGIELWHWRAARSLRIVGPPTSPSRAPQPSAKRLTFKCLFGYGKSLDYKTISFLLVGMRFPGVSIFSASRNSARCWRENSSATGYFLKFALSQVTKLAGGDTKLTEDFEKEWRANLSSAMQGYGDGSAVGVIPTFMTSGFSGSEETQATGCLLEFPSGGARHVRSQACQRGAACSFRGILRQSSRRL